MSKTLEQILKLDTKSDEFFEAYKSLSEKYWTFENPDDLQMAAKTLVMFAERYDTDKVILCHKIIEQLIKLDGKEKGPVTGNLVFKETSYFFDIYETEVQKDKMMDMLIKGNDLLKKGKVKVKDQHGKRFF